MGDVAMMVPVVSSLAHQYPHLRITVLSRPFARTFFEGLAPNVGFMGADLKNEYRGLKGLNALYRRLVAKNFTAIADMHSILRSSYLRMRFNIGRYQVAHIDKHRRERRALTATRNKVLEQLPTSFEGYADVLARLGYPVKLQFDSIFPPKGGDMSLIAQRINPKAEGERWIGIAPFAAHQGKVYPPEKMERVVQLLLERDTRNRIFLFGGGKEERDMLDEWEKRHDRCTCASTLLSALRRLRRDPPFADHFTLTVTGPEEEPVRRACVQLCAALRQALSQESYRAMEPEVLGPAPAPVVKLNNRYRYRITVVGQNEKPLRQLLAAYMKAFARRPEHRNMAVHTDCNLMD